jgi:uncharacterized protein YrrD
MSIKASVIGNLPIISLNNGENIHKVKDVIYDSKTNEVKALLIDEKGWFKGAKVLMLSDIASIGKDAITIKDSSCCVSSDDKTDDKGAIMIDDHNFITKNRVVTVSGNEIGRVSDIYFDFPSGAVTQIEVSEGLIENITTGNKTIHVSDIVTIGKDHIIVIDQYHNSEQRPMINNPSNEHKDDTEDTKAKIQQGAETAMAKTQEMAEEVKSKIDEAVASKPMQDAISKTQEVAMSIKDNIVNTYQKTKQKLNSNQTAVDAKDNIHSVKEILQDTEDKAEHKINRLIDSNKKSI